MNINIDRSNIYIYICHTLTSYETTSITIVKNATKFLIENINLLLERATKFV